MPRIITITSGKGGVGKTNLTVNLAAAFAKSGKRVVLLDADLGLANANILLNFTPEQTLEDVLDGTCNLQDILIPAMDNLWIIPGSSGIERMANMAPEEFSKLSDAFAAMDPFDYFLVDTSSGVADNVLQLALAAPETLLVMTPEPTSLTDGYALLKLLSQANYSGRVEVVINSSRSKALAERTFDKFREVSKAYLNLDLPLIGYIPFDARLPESVREQVPLIINHPYAPAARAITKLSEFLNDEVIRPSWDIDEFWTRLSPPQVEVLQQEASPVTAAVPSEKESTLVAPQPMQGNVEQYAERLQQETEAHIQRVESKLDNLMMKVESLTNELAETRKEAQSSERQVAASSGEHADEKLTSEVRRKTRHGRAGSVRRGQRAVPIDSVELRRVLGRMISKVYEEHGQNGSVRIDMADQLLSGDNELRLKPGNYSTVRVNFARVHQPDRLVEEVLESCNIEGCKVQHIDSERRYWLTRDFDGAILLQPAGGNTVSIQVYLPKASSSAEHFEGMEKPAVSRLKPEPRQMSQGLQPAKTVSELTSRYQVLLRPEEATDAGVSFYRLERSHRPPVVFAFSGIGNQENRNLESAADF